jgi:hypothetical protein
LAKNVIREPSPGRDEAYPIDISPDEHAYGFVLGEVKREGGTEFPPPMRSPSETVQAVVRELRPGLHAVKRIFVDKVGYAIFGEQDGMIVPGAKEDYAESIVELKRRFQRPN